VDQSTVGPWPSVIPAAAAAAATVVKCPVTSLSPVDNLTIDNMDDLPTFDAQSGDDVAQLSKTLIEFLLTRRVTTRGDRLKSQHFSRCLSFTVNPFVHLTALISVVTVLCVSSVYLVLYVEKLFITSFSLPVLSLWDWPLTWKTIILSAITLLVGSS